MSRHSSTIIEETNKTICSSIRIGFTMKADGLVGGEHEFDPYFASWASYNPHRIMTDQQELEVVVPQSFSQKGLSSILQEDETHMLSAPHGMPHKFNSGNHEWLFGLMNNEKKEATVEAVVEKDDFYIERNNAIYKTKNDIVYDMSNPAYHGNGTLLPDASIWMKLMAKTYSSGVPKIDESDRKFGKRTRTLQAGVYFIELYELFKLCAAQKGVGSGGGPRDVEVNIKGMFVDPKLMNMRLSEMYQKALKQGKVSKSLEQSMIEQAYISTRRAQLDLKITVSQFDLKNYRASLFSRQDLNTSSLSATIQMNATQMGSPAPIGAKSPTTFNNSGTESSPSTPHILYHSGPGVAQLRSAMDYVRQRYIDCFIEIENRPKPLYKALNKNIASLHLVEYMSDQGMQPVSAYWLCHTPITREYANDSLKHQDLALYGSNETTEQHLLLMSRSSLRRHGLSEAQFIKSVESHYDAHGNKNDYCEGIFITALKAVGDIGTFAGNSAYYTADFRFRDIGDPNDTGNMRHIKRVSLDSFDNNILNGIGSSDDCEGMDNIATPILHMFGHGRYDLRDVNSAEGKRGIGRWQSALLNAVKKVIDNSVIFDVGATVTSAYVDNNNKPINLKELKKDLPTIGDAIDKASHCDGHCYAFMVPLAVVAQMLNNGDLGKSVTNHPTFQSHSSTPQLRKRTLETPILVLEGTGSIESTVLPIDEVYSHEACKDTRLQARAAFNFMKELKLKVTDKQAPKLYKEMAEMFTGEGGEYYIAEQPHDRRVSTFYREVNGAIPCQLKAVNPSLIQVNFAKRDARTGQFVYGVNMGELLRAGVSESREVALVSPFNGCEKELQENAVPLMASIQNQMAMSKFGQYKKEVFGKSVYSKFMPNQRYRQSHVENMLASVATDPSLTVIRLQSREWKLAQREKFVALDQFLGALKGVVCHGFFREKHIDNCDAIVDILLVAKTSMYQ